MLNSSPSLPAAAAHRSVRVRRAAPRDPQPTVRHSIQLLARHFSHSPPCWIVGAFGAAQGCKRRTTAAVARERRETPKKPLTLVSGARSARGKTPKLNQREISKIRIRESNEFKFRSVYR